MSKRPGDPGYAANWCIHYQSPSHHKTCEAGIPFTRWDGTKFDQRPCFMDRDTGMPKPGALGCEHLRCPTPEEIAAHRIWLDERMNLLTTVMKGITPWREKHKGRSHAEVVECPACKGRLHLSIAAYNGHVHARCETEHCASWME